MERVREAARRAGTRVLEQRGAGGGAVGLPELGAGRRGGGPEDRLAREVAQVERRRAQAARADRCKDGMPSTLETTIARKTAYGTVSALTTCIAAWMAG